MGKLKRFGIGAGVTTSVLACMTGFWYKGHYTIPPIVESNPTTPSPNGFDTLQEALKLTVMEVDGVTIRPKPVPNSSPTRFITHLLAARLKLVQANAASIAKTREMLAQQYCIPPHKSDVLKGIPLRDQARMLIFAGDAYAGSGNLAEAARCYLDAIELGVTVPHGGRMMPFLYGTACENMGTAALDRVTDKLDAKTASAAAERLAKIEQERTPLSEILYQENYDMHHEMAKLFTDNPFTAWKNAGQYFGESSEAIDFISTIAGEESEPPSLAEKARIGMLKTVVTYQGPEPTIREMNRYMTAAAAQSELPWGPQRPPLNESGSNLLARLIGPMFGETDFHDRRARTNLALLQAKLRVRALFLETRRYPSALENLPTDPFSPTRRFLNYKSDGKTYTLWSVGPDAKDDGGTPPPSTSTDKKRKPNIRIGSEGDILA